MWRDGINEYCNKLVSDEEFENKKDIYPINTPMNKE